MADDGPCCGLTQPLRRQTITPRAAPGRSLVRARLTNSSTAISGQTNLAVKRGDLGDNGIYGAGDVCIFGGYVIG